MKYIDLRSDTVSHPTPEMREAMANAEVGDDVFGDDPTVNRLQEESAAMFGKEAGLFVASGTMGNLTSVLTHCGRGDEMILGKAVAYFQVRSRQRGGIRWRSAEHARSPARRHARSGRNPRSNPHRKPALPDHAPDLPGKYAGRRRAAHLSRKATSSRLRAIAREHNLKLHIDGARIFNAATALNTTVKDLTADADSVQFCFSKGLCAPVGSMVVGSREFISRAHRIRKSLGGGMRQAGILAAACLISLNTMSKRLGEDHANARALAEGLAALPYVQIDLDMVKTNMINFDTHGGSAAQCRPNRPAPESRV